MPSGPKYVCRGTFIGLIFFNLLELEIKLSLHPQSDRTISPSLNFEDLLWITFPIAAPSMG